MSKKPKPIKYEQAIVLSRRITHHMIEVIEADNLLLGEEEISLIEHILTAVLATKCRAYQEKLL